MSNETKHHIFHLIDANTDTSFFRALTRHHDHRHFPIAVGSIGPTGPLQQAMRSLSTPTFTLGATTRRQYGIALKRLTHLLRAQRHVILHAHCVDPTLLGLMAARLAGVPFIFTRHHSDHNLRLGKQWSVRVDAFCARHADHVIAVSEATRRIMIDIEKVPASQITVVYNGREPLPEPNPAKVQALRQQLGLGQEPVCLMLARLHEEKGHRYLFEAVPEVKRNIGMFTVLLAGDGPLRDELKADAQKRGLGQVVQFLGRRDDISELIELAAVVAQPSLAESFGIAVLEAMSLGKPVVASTAGGLPEVLGHGEAGLLVPPADSPALARALIRILQDAELAQKLGQAGRERAHIFNFERMMRGYESVYEQMLAQRPARKL